MIDADAVRHEFPVLGRQVAGRPVVFADNAATSLRPRCVIDAVTHYYTHVSANVHRGVNVLAEEADALFEDARRDIADFVNAVPEEIVFVRNATEAINLAVHIAGVTPADEVVTSLAEHHSNLLPWAVHSQMRAVVPDEHGGVSPAAFTRQFGPRTKLVALQQISNVVGVVRPVADVIQAARAQGILTLVDGAQSVPHLPVDVRRLGCDFLAFSGHKMLGPSGIGVLYARRALLEAAAPVLYGGGMVERVTATDFQVAPIPHRFEAGTPNIEGAIGLGAAVRFLEGLGMEAVFAHGRLLAERLVAGLAAIPNLRVRPARADGEMIPIVSCAFPRLAADDAAGMICNRFGIMVRSGVHCAEPLARHFGEQGVVRVSLYLYNTTAEVDYVVESFATLARQFA
jgi:cysteine desulfurase/selenocysteine lyase